MTSQETSHSGGTETSHQARRHRRGRARRTTVLAVGLVSALAIGTLGGVANAASVPPVAKGRVDLYTPTFANPLNITNPLFPKGPGKISQTVQLGDEPTPSCASRPPSSTRSGPSGGTARTSRPA